MCSSKFAGQFGHVAVRPQRENAPRKTFISAYLLRCAQSLRCIFSGEAPTEVNYATGIKDRPRLESRRAPVRGETAGLHVDGTAGVVHASMCT